METSAENHIEGNYKSREHDEESFSYAAQMANSLVLPMSLHGAIQLDIFEIIAKAGPDAMLSPKEIAAQLTTVNPEAPSMLDRILRVLASHAIVGCFMADDADEEGNPQRLYALTPVSRFFVRNEDGVSLGPLMSMVQGNVFLDSWSQLKDAILEGGIPFDRVHGMNSFDYPGKDPSFNQLFNTAMKNITTLVMKNILDAYKGFTDHLGQVIVDVGGCLGVSLSFITSKYPSIKGINYDLPHVIQHAPPIPGVEHVAGDMFQNVPKGDAIFIKGILHDWSDQHCLKILKNCYNAIPNDGKVIVVDYVVPVVPETNAQERYTSQLSVLMMTQNPGGKERTKQEFQALASKAGFSGIRFACLVCNLWVMEFFK